MQHHHFFYGYILTLFTKHFHNFQSYTPSKTFPQELLMSFTSQHQNLGSFFTAHISDEVCIMLHHLRNQLHLLHVNLHFFKNLCIMFHIMLNNTSLTSLQPYGELDPSFVQQRYHELGVNFIVMNRRCRIMTVKFNLSYRHPLITEGWSELRSFLGIHGNKMLLMTYLGNNRFLIDIAQPTELNPLELPAYHTYRNVALEPRPFEVTLTSSKKYKLVSFLLYVI
jgi:hypothetical protein